MPTYDYLCENCGRSREEIISIHKVPPIAEDPGFPCECGSTMLRQISVPTFTLKGMEGWPSKMHREANFRAKRNEIMDANKRDRLESRPGVRLAPNVDGERVESWADAQKLAASKGKDASTYEPLIRKEKDK